MKAEPYNLQMERNRKLFLPFVNDFKTKGNDDLESARLLFSNLAQLEQIAVLACERGAGIPGQYDDECAHRDTFAEIATALGGCAAPTQSIAALTGFLSGLRGPASLAVLNIVGEAWLGNLFSYLGPRGPWTELFTAIGEEESRHAREAASSLPALQAEEVRPLVGCLEELLWAVTVDPAFCWPLAFFSSLSEVGAVLAASAKVAHAQACVSLGIEPGFYAENIAYCGRSLETFAEPLPLLQTSTQKAFFHIKMPAIRLSFPVRWKHKDSEVEARVVQAVGAALSTMPRLNRTIQDARSEVYGPVRPVIGVRRKGGHGIITVYTRDPQLHEVSELRRTISDTAAHLHGLLLPDLRGISAPLLRLAPPPRCAATVTNVTPWTPRGGVGAAPLAPGEGATLSVCVTSLSRSWGRWTLEVTIDADHRAHNGEELARLGSFVQTYLER